MSTTLCENDSDFNLSEYLNETLHLVVMESSKGLTLMQKIGDKFYELYRVEAHFRQPDSKLFEVTIYRAESIYFRERL